MLRQIPRPRTAVVVSGLALSVLAIQINAVEPTVSLIDSSVKLRPTDPTPAEDVVDVIKAAQNEFEAAQLVIRGPASGVSVTPPDFVGPQGATIPSVEIRLYREDYVDVTTRSGFDGGTGRWPDALIPDIDEVVNEKRTAFPFDVPSGEQRIVWLEVHVPRQQTPGDYHGVVTVSGTGIGTISVPLTLRVWDFELPSTSSIASTFGMGWGNACFAHFGTYDACGGDAGVERMHLLYARFMLDHRISADMVYTGPTGCSGPDCDWSHFDGTYGAFFDGTDPNLRLAGARPTTIRYIWREDGPFYTAWAQHFLQRGWFGLTYHYTCDEPPNGCDWTAIRSRAALVHSADADFPTLVTTNIGEATANAITSSLNLLTPLVNHLDDKPGSALAGNQRASYDAFFSADPRNRLFWYQSCASHA